MPLSTSKAAYEDCFGLFNRALTSTVGIRAKCADRGEAFQLRMRLHYARGLHRDETRQVYEPDDPLYGISPFDNLIVREPQEINGEWWVYIEQRHATVEVEELKG